MSGKSHDILDWLESHLSQQHKEDVASVVDILSGYRPKVDIDRDFQQELKSTLLSEASSRKFSFFHFSWFQLFSGVGVLATSFIAVFGLYSIWDGSRETISVLTQWVETSGIMYSEEKAMKVAQIEDIQDSFSENTPTTLWSRKIPTGTASREERAKITNEMTSLGDDILDMADALPPGGTTDTPPEGLMRSFASEGVSPALLDMTTIDASASPYASMSPVPSMIDQGHDMPLTPPSLTDILTYTPSSYPVPVYPESMLLYMKPDAWTEAERNTRAGSGLITKEFPTEKRSVIQNKSNSLIAGRRVFSSLIIYRSMSKIAPNTEKYYYLVPVLEVTIEWGEKIRIPLIRGYR